MAVISEERRKQFEERERCKKDKMFLAHVLGYDFVDDVHTELFDQFFKYDPSIPWAQQSNIAKVLILWPRGHYKTTATIVAIIQLILNFPDIRILLMRGSVPLTRLWMHEIKAHFTGQNPDSRLKVLFPEFCEPDERGGYGNKDSFTTSARHNKGLASATITVAGPRSIKTGSHFDIGFFDDLLNDSNWNSPVKLLKVQADFNACLPLLDPPFYAIMTGTRYAFGDMYEQTIRNNTKGEWRVSFKTCWKDDAHTIPTFPQQLAVDGQGNPKLMPGTTTQKLIGFTKEMLDNLRDQDPVWFACQYMNQPIQQGGQRFTRALLESALVAVTAAPALSPAVLFVDLAGTDSTSSDDSCIIAGKHDLQMTQYVVDARGGQWLPPLLAENVINMALIHRPQMIYFEKTPGSIFFMDYLRLIALDRKVVLPMDFIKIDNNKDAKYIRIAALEGYIKHKRLKFFVGLAAWDKIVEQFGKFPGGKHKHDDYIDTIALMSSHMSALTPTRIIRPIKHPILAMIQQREQADARELELLRQQEPIDESRGFDAW